MSDYVIRDGVLERYEGTEDVCEVTVPDGVTSIRRRAFDSIKDSLRKITVPATLTKIEESAFEGYRRLEEAVLTPNTAIIKENCFRDCINLREISGTGGLKCIGNEAFKKTMIRHIELPAIEELGVSAFESCADLQTVVLSGKIDYIPSRCFAYCRSLSSVQLPEGVGRISEEVFVGSPLPRINIPSSVYGIKVRSYYGNRLFEASTVVTIDPGNPYYEVVDGSIVERPFHEEGGIYTVMPEYDKAGRAERVRDKNGETLYYLKKTRYSPEDTKRFLEVCGAYVFGVHEEYREGNDDYDIEEVVSETDYFTEIPITSAVIDNGDVIGFVCPGGFLPIDDPGICITADPSYSYPSVYRYEAVICKYRLALKDRQKAAE